MNEENTYPHRFPQFREKETAISEETNRLVKSLNQRDSSESSSDSNEEKNTPDNLQIFKRFGKMGDWWKQPSVQPMLIKISERVSRTPTLQHDWKLKDIVRQTENSFSYCKMGYDYDRGCMGARMGNIQKYITNLEMATLTNE